MNNKKRTPSATDTCYLQMYPPSLALSSTPHNVFAVIGDCYFPLSHNALSAGQSLLPGMMPSPRPLHLSPAMRSYSDILGPRAYKWEQVSPFIVSFFQGSPTVTFLGSPVAPAFSSKTIPPFPIHHRSSTQDYKTLTSGFTLK